MHLKHRNLKMSSLRSFIQGIPGKQPYDSKKMPQLTVCDDYTGVSRTLVAIVSV